MVPVCGQLQSGVDKLQGAILAFKFIFLVCYSLLTLLLVWEGPIMDDVLMEVDSEEAGDDHICLASFAPIAAMRKGRKSTVLAEIQKLGESSRSSAHAAVHPIQSGHGATRSGLAMGAHSTVQATMSSSCPPLRTSLSVPMVESYVVPKDGFCNSSVISPVLLEICHKNANTSGHVDVEYLALEKEFLLHPCYHMASVLMRADRLEMDRRSLQTKLCRLMCSQWLYSKVARQLLEQQCVAKLPELVLYVDHSAYDETSMRGKVKSKFSSQDHVCGGTDAVSASLEVQQLQLAKSWDASGSIQSLQLKYLQTQQKFAMLMKHGQQFLRLVGCFASPLQIMERATHEVLARCLVANSGVSIHSQKFGMKVRSCCSDKAGSNILAERLLCKQRSSGWLLHHVSCEAHAVSTCIKRTMQLVPSQITGLLHAALSLRSGGAFELFKRSLLTVVRGRIRILYGSPTRAAQIYKRQAMMLFMSDSSSNLMQKMIISSLPNGDWRNRSCIEFYPQHIGMASSVDAAQLLGSGIIHALCSHQPSIYPAHRWTGCDVSIDELAKLECIHGLLSLSYEQFLIYYSQPGLEPCGHMNGVDETQVLHPLPLQDDVAIGPADGSGGEALDMHVADGVAQIDEHHRSSEQHSRDRKLASQWLGTRPLGKLIAMRACLAPLMTLLYAEFQVNSMAWELEQRSKLASAQVLRGAAAGVKRQYPLTIAAEGLMEEKFAKQVMSVFENESVWCLVPDNELVVSFNALIFTMLCREAAMVEQLVSSVHKKFPICLYRLLANPGLGESLASTKRCLLDPWSLALLQKFPGFSSDTLLEVLEMHAVCGSTSIADTESLHASNRRVLTQRSVQTWSVPVATASAEWLAQSMRRNLASPLFAGRMGVPAMKSPRSLEKVVGKANPNAPCIACNNIFGVCPSKRIHLHSQNRLSENRLPVLRHRSQNPCLLGG